MNALRGPGHVDVGNVLHCLVELVLCDVDGGVKVVYARRKVLSVAILIGGSCRQRRGRTRERAVGRTETAQDVTEASVHIIRDCTRQVHMRARGCDSGAACHHTPHKVCAVTEPEDSEGIGEEQYRHREEGDESL